jgi:predicted nucleic acid-binding protein
LSSLDLDEIEALVTANITFVNESLIPKSVLINAEKLVKDIDPNDTVFVAMADFLNANLWSGDRKLITGLRLKNYHNIIETSGLSLLWDDLEN